MNLKHLNAVVAVVAALFANTPCAAGKPNIIFIMTDDQGYGDASSYNNLTISFLSAPETP